MANKLYTQWPADLPKSANKHSRLLHKQENSLPSLNITHWHLVQNPDFNKLILVMDNNDVRLVRKWVNSLQMLGQSADLILSIDQTDILITRPVLTSILPTELTLHYLHNGAEVRIM